MKNEMIIVGVGASAGGLEALLAFVKYLPVKTNIAYLVAQHLSPTYKSLMVDLLSKDSTISIQEAHHQEQIKPNTMYICPPNKNIIIEGNQILLIDPKQLTYGPKPSINLLFESIASNKGSKSIGIILSGTGSDGSRGVRAIKAEGGFTIAQQPQSAKYDGMPNSAINTGNIDLILDAEVMGSEIVEILKYPNKAGSISNINEKTQVYRNILTKLQRNKKIDFSLYKSSTIQRRIERRMAALKITNLNDYSDYIIKEDKELDSLFKDILIGVTSFFRDEYAFEALETTLKERIALKTEKTIRIWTPGCSTGEEAYSIAILISEILENSIPDYKIQIFATDIDEDATAFARAARYPESALINVDKKYIKKYFTIKNDEYEVIKPIRDMCIFSRHDITNDPAFMRLDLISCRNLLIYFTSELQQRIFPMFHYSLNDNGILFLGKSESVGGFNHHFKIIDKKWKIYEAAYLGQKSAPNPVKIFIPKPYKKEHKENNDQSNIPTISQMMVEHIQRHIMPMCVVVNDSFDMIFIKGKNPYLVHPEGEITQNIFKNIRSELNIELRSALHKCKKESNLVKSQFYKLSIGKEIRYVRMLIAPLDNVMSNNLFMICFQEEESDNLKSYNIINNDLNSNEENEHLKLELERTKEHLQTVIEELETSNEEMQSLNEELQSSNEELQSSNEELETTNEELQSTNEELQTAYTEMRAMYEEREKDTQRISEIKEHLENSNSRLKTVLESSGFGVFDYGIIGQQSVYIDENWAKIFGYTKDEIFNLTDNLVEWFEKRIHEEDIEHRTRSYEDILLGKKENYQIEIRVKNKNDEYIWIRCFTIGIKDEYTKNIGRILGTISDISDEKVKEEILQRKKSYIDSIMHTSLNGMYIFDFNENKNIYINPQYTNFTGYTFEELKKLNSKEFLKLYHPDELDSLFEHINQVKNSKDGEVFELKYRFKHKNGHYIWCFSRDAVLKRDDNGNPVEMIGTFIDFSNYQE